MRALQIHHDRPRHELAADLRRAFSGIVAGNVKEEGVQAIEQHGPFDIDGDPEIMRALDKLLQAFVPAAPDEAAGRCSLRAVLPGRDQLKLCGNVP